MNLTQNQLKALDLKRNLVVTAGAGSGKTTILVNRYLHILLENEQLDVQNVLAITFTEKAAAEMKERIFKEITRQFKINRAKQARLFNLLQQLHNVQISTIHSFCTSILRQFAVEAQLDPGFQVLSDFQVDDLLNQTFREFFLTYQATDITKRTFILKALREYSIPKLRQTFTGIYHARAILYPFLEQVVTSAPEDYRKLWQDVFIEYHKTVLNPLINSQQFWENIKSLIEIDERQKKNSQDKIHSLSTLYHSYQESEHDRFNQIKLLIKIIKLLTKNDGEAYMSVPGGKKFWGEQGVSVFKESSSVAARYSHLVLPLNAEVEDSYCEIYTGISEIIFKLLKAADERKMEIEALDFDDLQIKVLELLQQYPDIRNQLRKRYPFILVDEFQDTDLLQSSIIHLLSHDQLGQMDANRLFVVGDAKQSIFGFRYSDVSIFQDYTRKISEQGSDKIPLSVAGLEKKTSISEENRRGIITMSKNFRSTPNLIDFFNCAFINIFQTVSDWDVEFQELEVGKTAIAKYKSQIQLDLFFDESDKKLKFANIEIEKLIEIIQEIIQNTTYKKTILEDGEIKSVPLQFGDIAILLRSRTYLSELEKRLRNSSIPYQTYKGTGFFQRREIQDLYYLLQSILNPHDDFSLLTVLRSEFVGLSDVVLFYLSQAKGQSYWDKLQLMNSFLEKKIEIDELFNPEFLKHINNQNHSWQISGDEKRSIKTAVSKYKYWMELAFQGQVSKLLDTIIEGLQMKALLTLDPDGEQNLANLNKFIHYVFEFEEKTSPSLTDLVETIRKQIRGEISEGEAVIMAPDLNKVNILTYHSAKGMEFPLVVLPFLGRSFQYNSGLLIDKNYGFALELDRTKTNGKEKPFIYQYLKLQDQLKIDAEEKRLFYVATTRAKDHLFLLGSVGKQGTISKPSYLNWLLNSLDIPITNTDKKDQFTLQNDRLKIEIFQHYIKEWKDVEKYKTKETPHDITSIDIIPEPFLRYQLFKDEEAEGQEYSTTQLMLFRENRRRYFSHYYLKEGQVLSPDVALEYLDEPGGALWGSIVHKFLEDFYLRNAKEDKSRIQWLFRQYDIDRENEQVLTSQLNTMAKKIRTSPIGKKIKKGSALSEYKAEMQIGKFILKGIFDCVFRNPDHIWEIIDYKTNRISKEEVRSTAKKYEFQMRAYALLLSNFLPKQVEYPVTLYFLEPDKTFRKVFHILEIESTRTEVKQLIEELFKIEKEIFYSPK